MALIATESRETEQWGNKTRKIRKFALNYDIEVVIDWLHFRQASLFLITLGKTIHFL